MCEYIIKLKNLNDLFLIYCCILKEDDTLVTKLNRIDHNSDIVIEKTMDLDDHVVPFHTINICLIRNGNEKDDNYKFDDCDYVDNERENVRHHSNEKHLHYDNNCTEFLLFGEGMIFV